MARAKGPSKFDTGAPPKRLAKGDFVTRTVIGEGGGQHTDVCMIRKVSPEGGATITSIEVWMGQCKAGRPITQSFEPGQVMPYTGTVHAFEAPAPRSTPEV